MTTIEERHKIAERLRMRLANWSGMGWRIHIPEIGNGVWMENHGGNDELEEAAKRLADLIDPSEPKVKCVAEVKVDGEQLEKLAHDAAVELTGIDRDALMALADEMEEFAETENCAQAIDDAACNRINAFADRIREAVGA